MKHIDSALLIYPHQLFATEHLPKVDMVYVIEDPLFFGVDADRALAFHKQKLIFHRASMRRYIEEQLWANEIDVEYMELADVVTSGEVLSHVQKAGASLVYMFDACDDLLEQRLKGALASSVSSPFELRVLPSPGFMLRRGEAEDFFAASGSQNTSFAAFYQWQRERFNILIDKKYKPVGGKWMLEEHGNDIAPDASGPVGFASFGNNKFTEEATKWVEKRFPGNPGSSESFVWPTNHEEGIAWLHDFLEHRLQQFTRYDRSLDGEAMLLLHSGIAGALNSGLLTPLQVVEAVVAHTQKTAADIAGSEQFIRRIIGWREYVRGLYVTDSSAWREKNVFEHTADLPIQVTRAQTDLPPVDDVMRKVDAHAYATDVERLLIITGIMNFCAVQPANQYAWFMAMFIDAYDWVVVPNVYGAGQLDALGGLISGAPLVDSRNLLAVSNYKADDWCDVWDGLFWHFVDENQEILAKNSLTASLPKRLKKLDADKKRIIGYRAQDFLSSVG